MVRGPRGNVRGVAGGRAPVVAEREVDRMEQEDEQTIQFSALTDDDLDGFDFEVTRGARSVRFMLLIDGKPEPDEVEIGRDNFKPQESPVVVRLSR